MKVRIDSPWLNILIPALIIRLIFAAFFFHPDIKSQHFHAQFLSRGIADIYSFIGQNKARLPYTDSFNYPPLAYYFLGSWDKIAGWIIGPQTLGSWLNDWGPLGYFNSRMFEIMLVLKLPYLLFDLACGLLLAKFITEKKHRRLLIIFWFYNPVTLYAVYMLSQFDIVCAFLTVAALYLIKDRKNSCAALLLGLGAALKTYPLLLMPFLLFRSRNLKQFIISAMAFITAFIFPMLPVLNSNDYRYTMTHSNLMQGIFISGLEVSPTQRIPYYVLVYALMLVYSWFSRQRSDVTPEFLVTTFYVILLSPFHAQWIVWSMPFIALLWTRLPSSRRWLIYICLLSYFAVSWLTPDQYVFLGLFSPLNSQSVMFPALSEMIKLFIDPWLLQGLFQAILTGSGIWLTYFLWKSYASE